MIFFRHGHNRFFRIHAGGAGIFCLVVFVGLGLCLKNDNAADSADEQCIQCHVGMWNTAIALPNQHLPFLDRNCTVCHLAETAGTPVMQTTEVAALFTGSTVSQEPQWAKRQVFKGAADLSGEQGVVLAGLVPDARYRFRAVSDDIAAKFGQAVGPWLGLLPQEVLNGGPVDVPPLSLSKAGKGEVLVAWHDAAGTKLRVEVEEISMLGAEPSSALPQPEALLTDATETATEQASIAHPPMRSPAEITIDICYSCHPKSDLGASHPVRIYAHGGDTIIPDDLPTVERGMLTCVTCHDPHAAIGKQLVREEVATKLCVACHVSFQGSSKSTIF
jgi:predicted CXXCH cytochrome family protein